jgi:hypothetical protein
MNGKRSFPFYRKENPMKLFCGVTFSLNRFWGIIQAKQRFSRKTGVPTTKNGMLRKISTMILMPKDSKVMISLTKKEQNEQS